MRRRATQDEVDKLIQLKIINLTTTNKDINIVVTDEPTDLIEGLERDEDREVMRYLLLSPETYQPPMRDKETLIEKLDVVEESKWGVDDITMVYEVVKNNKTNTIKSAILMSPITDTIIKSLQEAEDLIKVQRNLEELITNLGSDGDLIFGSKQEDELFQNIDDTIETQVTKED